MGGGTSNLQLIDYLNVFLIFTRNSWFLQIYYVMLIISPFLNLALQRLTKKQFLFFVSFLLLITSVFSPNSNIFLNDNSIISNVLWIILVYSLATYIKFFPNDFKSKKIALLGIIVSLTFKFILPSGFNEARNNICVIFLSLFLFLFFNNLKMKQNKFINLIASTTLGVYLLHENRFRFIIWRDLLKIPNYAQSDYLWLISIGSVIAVFIVCSFVVLFFRYTIGNFLFKKLNKLLNNVYIRVDSFFPHCENDIKEDKPFKAFWLHCFAFLLIDWCAIFGGKLFKVIPINVFFMIGIFIYIFLVFLVLKINKHMKLKKEGILEDNLKN